MCHMLFRGCLLMLLLMHGHCATIQTTVETPFCDASMDLALTNTVAYNVAFSWSKHANLHHWNFQPSMQNSSKIQCVSYSYTTQIKLPGVFSDYVGNLLRRIGVHKEVCVANHQEYMEQVQILDTAIISNLHSNARSHVEDGTLITDITISYDLPWFGIFLESLASKHILNSFVEKYTTLSNTLCSEAS